jgi:multidrug efflux system membrane fusion protein
MLTMSMSPRRSPRTPRSGRGPAAPPGAASLLSVLLLVSAVLSSLWGCSGDKVESTPAPKRPAVPVGVAAVEQKTIPLQIQAIGTVEASAVVSIKAQVGGELLRVHIKEGQDVKTRDLLFSFDPRVYEAALAQAEANLARDRGQIQHARAVLEREQARIGQARAGLLRDQGCRANRPRG